MTWHLESSIINTLHIVSSAQNRECGVVYGCVVMCLVMCLLA